MLVLECLLSAIFFFRTKVVYYIFYFSAQTLFALRSKPVKADVLRQFRHLDRKPPPSSRELTKASGAPDRPAAAKKITRSTRRGLSSYICVRPAATASRPLRGSESAATRRMLPVLDFLQNSSFSFIYEPRRLYNLHQIPRTNRSHRDVNESAYFSCRKFAQNFAKTSSTRDLG